MRRLYALTFASLLALVALAGCGAKQTATDTTATSDSLLSSNPVEQPSGSITPTTDMSQQQAPATTPPAESAPATKPATTSSKPKPHPTASKPAPAKETGVTVDAGTTLSISVDTQLSSETANVGDTWSGTIKENVIVGDHVVFPAGSVVSGVVTESVEAGAAKAAGKTASLGLGVTAITVNGTKHAIEAGTETIVANSARTRNIGGVAAGAGAGALIGKAVGGGKGALIGGLLGGGAGAAAAAKSKGFQATVKEGVVITFSVKAPVTVHS